jgi:hexosaminidase
MVVDFQPSGVWDGAGRVHETPGSWPDLGPEAYRLTVTSQGAAVEAGGPAGLFYAYRTLDQLRFHHTVGGRTAIPAQTITDGPRWPHRGLMVDVARHWFPAPEIRRLLELMSHLKLNVFHWHLTDDQGWRLPVPGWPRLNEGVPAYTEEEIRGVVQFAADRHITVIPEVDLPGHFSAALAAYPELGCTKKPVRRASGPGIYFDIACAGSDRTMAFLEDVVASVCDLFPGPRVHLGGDEAPKLRWKGCPDCQARIEREGLAGEEELQGW